METIFYVDELSIDISCNALVLTPGEVNTELSGYVADVNVSLLQFQQMFQWHTDSVAWTETENEKPIEDEIKFRIVTEATNFKMNISNQPSDTDTYRVYMKDATQAAGGVFFDDLSNNILGLDYLRRQSIHYFGTINGVDLFNNENTTLKNLQSDFKTNLENTILGFPERRTTAAEWTDSYGIPTTVDGICKKIFYSILQNRSHRFKSINPILGTDQFWYAFDFIAGDIIAFNLNIGSNSQQTDITAGENSIQKLENQKYLIQMHLVNNP
jgi:hypothetical protein